MIDDRKMIGRLIYGAPWNKNRMSNFSTRRCALYNALGRTSLPSLNLFWWSLPILHGIYSRGKTCHNTDSLKTEYPQKTACSDLKSGPQPHGGDWLTRGEVGSGTAWSMCIPGTQRSLSKNVTSIYLVYTRHISSIYYFWVKHHQQIEFLLLAIIGYYCDAITGDNSD